MVHLFSSLRLVDGVEHAAFAEELLHGVGPVAGDERDIEGFDRGPGFTGGRRRRVVAPGPQVMLGDDLAAFGGVEEAEILFMHFVDAPVSYLILEVLDKTPMVELLAIIENIRMEKA
jgi:hypothetical protein